MAGAAVPRPAGGRLTAQVAIITGARPDLAPG